MSQYQTTTPSRQLTSPLSYTFNDPKKRGMVQGHQTTSYGHTNQLQPSPVNYSKVGNRPTPNSTFPANGTSRRTTTTPTSGNYTLKPGGASMNSISRGSNLKFHQKNMRSSFNTVQSNQNAPRASVNSSNGRTTNGVLMNNYPAGTASRGNTNPLSAFNPRGTQTNTVNGVKTTNTVNKITTSRPQPSQGSTDLKVNEPITDRVNPQGSKFRPGPHQQNSTTNTNQMNIQKRPQGSLLSMKQNNQNPMSSTGRPITGPSSVNQVGSTAMPQNNLQGKGPQSNMQLNTPRRRKKNPLKCKFQQNLENGYSPKPNRSNRNSGLNHVQKNRGFQTDNRLSSKGGKKYDFGRNNDPSWKKDVNRKSKKKSNILMRQTTPLYQPKDHRLPNTARPALKSESSYVQKDLYLNNESKKGKKYKKGKEEGGKPLKLRNQNQGKGVKFNHDVEVYNVESYKMYNVDMGKRARRRARKEMAGECNLF